MQLAIVKRLLSDSASNSKLAPFYSAPDDTTVIVNGIIFHYNSEAGGDGADLFVAVYVSDVDNSSANDPQDSERLYYFKLKPDMTLEKNRLPIILNPGDGIHIQADVTGVINVALFGSEVTDN